MTVVPRKAKKKAEWNRVVREVCFYSLKLVVGFAV